MKKIINNIKKKIKWNKIKDFNSPLCTLSDISSRQKKNEKRKKGPSEWVIPTNKMKRSEVNAFVSFISSIVLGPRSIKHDKEEVLFTPLEHTLISFSLIILHSLSKHNEQVLFFFLCFFPHNLHAVLSNFVLIHLEQLCFLFASFSPSIATDEK